MRSESEIPWEDVPFTIPVADRVKRLPPYLFGKINKLKYQKRVAGVDVIDLGMGNPTDAPEPAVSDKLAEAIRDPRNHRYSVSNGIANLRKEVAKRYRPQVRRVARPRHRSHRHDRQQGRLQPHVPGPDGAGRHGDRARPRRSRFMSMRSRSLRGT